MKPANQQALDDIVNGNMKALRWLKTAPGQYHVETSVHLDDTRNDTLITNQDLCRIDERLVDVVNELADAHRFGQINTTLVVATYWHHWNRKYHTLDLQFDDNVYHEHLAPEEQPTWYIKAITGMSTESVDEDLLELRFNLYFTEKTALGTEFISRMTDAWFQRPHAWLDQHIQSGQQLLSWLVELGVPSDTWADYLNRNYLANIENSSHQKRSLILPTDFDS